jgi:WD40-like Beta Propeller Repeat
MTEPTRRLRVLIRLLCCTLLASAPLYACAGVDAPTGTDAVATRLDFTPRDTTIGSGGTYILRAYWADQKDHWTACTNPTYSATGVTVTATGRVTGNAAVAYTPIVVKCNGLTDTAKVSVLPPVRLVVNRFGIIDLVNADGTNPTRLVTDTNYSMAPSSVAATPNVVYYKGDPLTNAKIWVVQPNGVPRLLLNGPTRPEAWPRLSQDGVWVYFVRDRNTLWRAHLDGSGLDSVASFAPPQVYRTPTISPDGSSVAVDDSSGLKIIDVATKTARVLPVTCHHPRYSPDGAWFACAGDGATYAAFDVTVVRSDGTGGREIAKFIEGTDVPDPFTGLDWTPDGKWVLCLCNRTRLINFSDGSMIPISNIGPNVFQPSLVR